MRKTGEQNNLIKYKPINGVLKISKIVKGLLHIFLNEIPRVFQK